MKKRLHYLLFSTVFIGTTATAQSVYTSDTTAKQSITSSNQLFTFTFPATGIPESYMGAQGKLIIYYKGDFGSVGETINVLNETGSGIGTTTVHGGDCLADSSIITFDAGNISTTTGGMWLADGQVDFSLIISSSVDPGLCTADYIQCRLYYEYCPGGGAPLEMADFTISPSICRTADAMLLTGTPTGGTFTGMGITGSTFTPSSITSEETSITYTAQDANGCESKKTKMVTIVSGPQVTITDVCPTDDQALLEVSTPYTVWYADPDLTQSIDTNATLSIDGSVSQHYYVKELSINFNGINELSTANSFVTNHATASGDDRAGIAVTPEYVYVVGDSYTVRAKASDLSNQVSLPMRDGIFSDLSTGKLYTLWNTTTNSFTPYTATTTANAIVELDENLQLTATHPLSMPFTITSYTNILFAGAGYVAVFTYTNLHVYVINLNTFNVQDLGVISGMSSYGPEGWASWGVLEYDGTTFSGVYRYGSGNTPARIVRKPFVVGDNTAGTNVYANENGLGQLASLTVSPWNNRWYFHYEGSVTDFGPLSDENFGYANADLNVQLTENTNGCPTDVLFIPTPPVNLIENTTVCQNNLPLMLNAGSGYDTYTWNGTAGAQQHQINAAGTYIVEAIDSIGTTACVYSDTSVVTVIHTNGVDLVQDSIACYGSFPLQLNAPTGYQTYSWNGNYSNSNTFEAIPGSFTLEVTDANGCTITDQFIIAGDPCLGIDELGLNNITLAPNPTSDQTIITINASQHGQTIFTVRDLNGKSIMTKEVDLNSGENTIVLDVVDFSPGMYFVHFGEKNNQNKILRLVVN